MANATTDAVRHGRRLVPALIDEIAKKMPDRFMFCIPKTQDPKDKFHDVTFADFARATNRAAAWIETTLGRSAEGEFETLAYIGLFDIRYFVIVVAASKLGYKVSKLQPEKVVTLG